MALRSRSLAGRNGSIERIPDAEREFGAGDRVVEVAGQVFGEAVREFGPAVCEFARADRKFGGADRKLSSEVRNVGHAA